MEQSQVYEIKDMEHTVYKLHKALYGLKQTPCGWNNRIDKYIASFCLQKSSGDSSIYVGNGLFNKSFI